VRELALVRRSAVPLGFESAASLSAILVLDLRVLRREHAASSLRSLPSIRNLRGLHRRCGPLLAESVSVRASSQGLGGPPPPALSTNGVDRADLLL